MNYETIADIYAANDKIRGRLKNLVAELSAEEADFCAEEGKWSIANLVEHIAIVEEGMSRISAKLLSKAENKTGADGKAKISENFLRRSAEVREQKMEAPEMVRPTGKLSVAESLARMEENRRQLENLRPLFETVECSDYKFPHPFMGDLTAHEWLALIGGHTARHLAQIEKILSARRAESN